MVPVFPTKCGWWLNVDLTFCHSFTWVIFFFCDTDNDVLLTVHLGIFISVFNQLDAQNLFYNKFYFMPPHVSSTRAHHQEVKIALHSLWYRHAFRWPSHAQVERELSLNLCTRRPPIGVMIPEAV